MALPGVTGGGFGPLLSMGGVVWVGWAVSVGGVVWVGWAVSVGRLGSRGSGVSVWAIARGVRR